MASLCLYNPMKTLEGAWHNSKVLQTSSSVCQPGFAATHAIFYCLTNPCFIFLKWVLVSLFSRFVIVLKLIHGNESSSCCEVSCLNKCPIWQSASEVLLLATVFVLGDKLHLYWTLLSFRTAFEKSRKFNTPKFFYVPSSEIVLKYVFQFLLFVKSWGVIRRFKVTTCIQRMKLVSFFELCTFESQIRNQVGKYRKSVLFSLRVRSVSLYSLYFRSKEIGNVYTRLYIVWHYTFFNPKT